MLSRCHACIMLIFDVFQVLVLHKAPNPLPYEIQTFTLDNGSFCLYKLIMTYNILAGVGGT